MDNIKDDFFVKDSQNQATTTEQLLDKNEKVLWKARPKKFAYMMSQSIAMAPFAILWLVFDLTAIIALFSVPMNEAPPFIPFVLIGFFAVHLTPVWIWLGQIIKASKDMHTIEYIITNKRVLEIRGKANRYIHSSIKLNEIEDAKLNKNFIDKILKVGDIYVSSKENKIVLFDVTEAEFVVAKLLQLVHNPEKSKREEFYENSHECAHCGTYYDSNKSKCPSCGAPIGRR